MAKSKEAEALKKPDSFVLFFQDLLSWVNANFKTVMVGFVFIFFGIAGYFYAQKIQKERNLEAADAWAKVVEKQPLTDEKAESWLTFENEVSTFLSTYSKSSVIPMANFYVAKAQLHQKKYDQAIEVYQGVQTKLVAPYNLLAMEGEAVSLQFQEKYEESMPIWEKLAGMAAEANPFKDYHLWNAALNLEKIGKADEAQKHYQQIVDAFEDSKYASLAKLSLKETTPVE